MLRILDRVDAYLIEQVNAWVAELQEKRGFTWPAILVGSHLAMIAILVLLTLASAVFSGLMEALAWAIATAVVGPFLWLNVSDFREAGVRRALWKDTEIPSLVKFADGCRRQMLSLRRQLMVAGPVIIVLALREGGGLAVAVPLAIVMFLNQYLLCSYATAPGGKAERAELDT